MPGHMKHTEDGINEAGWAREMAKTHPSDNALLRATLKRSSLTAADIKAIRLTLYRTQVEFAALCGVRPETVSRWETGTVRPEAHADRLMRFLLRMRLHAPMRPLLRLLAHLPKLQRADRDRREAEGDN